VLTASRYFVLVHLSCFIIIFFFSFSSIPHFGMVSFYSKLLSEEFPMYESGNVVVCKTPFLSVTQNE
jgi:hypothetical protein